MKNLITITALLAAGAIAANADTLLPGANYSGLTWNQLTLTSPSDNKLETNNSPFNWSEQQGNLTESWSLLFTLSQNSSSGNVNVFSTNASNGAAGGLSLGLKTEEGVGKTVGLYTNNVSGLNLGSVTFSAGQNVMLTFLKYADTEEKAGKFVLSTYDVTGSTSPSQITEFDVEKSQQGLTFLKNSLFGTGTRLWTNGGRETFSNIKLAYGSAIPEPSAFGLLAGLGALALVGARRRRK